MGRRKWITKKEAEAISKLPAGKKKWYGFFMSALFLIVAIIDFCVFPSSSIVLGVIFLTFSGAFFIYAIYYTFIAYTKKIEQKKREEILVKANIQQVDNMDGITFENFLATLFKRKGYQVTLTKTTGDYGVDLILTSSINGINEKIIVQAKRYSKKVPISAIQEISAARNYYHTNNAWVITNNYFTNPAINLAKANSIKLIDRDKLSEIIVSTSQTDNNEKEQLSLEVQEKSTPTKTSSSHLKSYEKSINQDSMYSKNLYNIKNNILKIYPTFDLKQIKKQIVVAEDYIPNGEQQYISLHFFYSDIINIIYALRDTDPTALNYCLELCEKDIEILQKTSLSELSVTSLTRKAIYFEKQNKISEAIQVCDFAIEHNYYDNGKSFGLRKIRLQKKQSLS